MTPEALSLSPERQMAYATDEDESLWARVNRICDKYIQGRQQATNPDAHKLCD